MSAQLAIGLLDAVWLVEARSGLEDWERIAAFLYYDQAHIFITAIRKPFASFEYRVLEIEDA